MHVTLSKEFPYVATALLSTAVLLQWQAGVVSRARRKAQINYPQLYAEKAQVDGSVDALRFNCAQRAHHQTLEVVPSILITTLLTAVKYPMVAAAGCGFFVIGRVLFTLGYCTGDPKKRYSRGGWIGIFGQVGLVLSSIASIVAVVRES